MDLPRVALRTLICGCTLALLAGAARAVDPAVAAEAPEVKVPAARSVPEARRMVTAAQKDITRWRATVNRRRQALESSLHAMPEYRQALAERNRAKTAYEVARRPALSGARSSDAYVAAQKRLRDAKAAMAAATRSARLGGGDALAAMTQDVREAETALKEAEAQLVLADPVAAEAMAALDAAEAALAALRKQHVDDVLERDPAAHSARLHLASAEARHAAAEAELARVRNAEAEEEYAGVSPGGLAYGNVAGPRSPGPRISVGDYARAGTGRVYRPGAPPMRSVGGRACIGGA